MLRRKIPLNYRNVTGVASSRSSNQNSSLSNTPFESTLEHDFIMLLRFDDSNVRSYQTQTPIIHYLDDQGKNRRYTPDVFVTYVDDTQIMYEVKPRKLLSKSWAEYKPRFKQAIRYGKEHGYRFKIITDHEIRNDYCQNVRFLQRYKNQDNYDPRFRLILGALREKEVSTPADVINGLAQSKQTRAELLFTFWQLVADGIVGVDLNERLRMDSKVWYRLEMKWQ